MSKSKNPQLDDLLYSLEDGPLNINKVFNSLYEIIHNVSRYTEIEHSYIIWNKLMPKFSTYVNTIILNGEYTDEEKRNYRTNMGFLINNVFIQLGNLAY